MNCAELGGLGEPDPKVIAYPADGVLLESITKRYADALDPNDPLLTVAEMLDALHEVGVMIARFVQAA